MLNKCSWTARVPRPLIRRRHTPPFRRRSMSEHLRRFSYLLLPASVRGVLRSGLTVCHVCTCFVCTCNLRAALFPLAMNNPKRLFFRVCILPACTAPSAGVRCRLKQGPRHVQELQARLPVQHVQHPGQQPLPRRRGFRQEEPPGSAHRLVRALWCPISPRHSPRDSTRNPSLAPSDILLCPFPLPRIILTPNSLTLPFHSSPPPTPTRITLNPNLS